MPMFIWSLMTILVFATSSYRASAHDTSGNTRNGGVAGQARGQKRSPAKSPAVAVDIRALLSRGLAVNGSCTLLITTKDTSIPGASWRSTDTWAEWRIDMSLENRTGRSLQLDSTIFVVETGPNGTGVLGNMIVKAKRLRPAVIPPVIQHVQLSRDGKDIVRDMTDHSSPYRLDAFDAFDGSTEVRDFGSGLRRLMWPGLSSHFKVGAYGRLEPRAVLSLRESVRPGRWFQDEQRTGVYLVLPEVHVGTPESWDSYQPIAVLEPSGGEHAWKVREVFVIHETPDDLAAAMSTGARGLFTQILAANRLAEYFPEQAGPQLASTAKGSREGDLLACVIDLAARTGTPLLQDYCRGLLADATTPKEIQQRAKAYLEAIEAKKAPG